MKTIDEIMTAAKQQLARYGRLMPTILVEGTGGSEAFPLPDLTEELKLSLLDALGDTLAREDRVGELLQLFLVAEAWRSARNGAHPALRPQHDPQRVECVMAFHYRVASETRRMVVYDIVRNEAGELTELKPLDQLQAETSAAESPPLDALLRGFKRGWRRRDTGASAA